MMRLTSLVMMFPHATRLCSGPKSTDTSKKFPGLRRADENWDRAPFMMRTPSRKEMLVCALSFSASSVV